MMSEHTIAGAPVILAAPEEARGGPPKVAQARD